jgi:hypothetical protein
MSTPEGLTQDELDAQDGEQLPEREAMSIVGPDVGFSATPVPVGRRGDLPGRQTATRPNRQVTVEDPAP